MLLLVCIFCVVAIKVLAFDSREGDAGGDKGEETIVGRMIERIAAGEVDLSDEDSIRKALGEVEQEFGITLTEENRDRVVAFMKTLDSVEESADDFMDRAKQMYQKYSSEFVEQANDTIKGALKNAAKEAVRGFFEGLFSKNDE